MVPASPLSTFFKPGTALGASWERFCCACISKMGKQSCLEAHTPGKKRAETQRQAARLQAHPTHPTCWPRETSVLPRPLPMWSQTLLTLEVARPSPAGSGSQLSGSGRLMVFSSQAWLLAPCTLDRHRSPGPSHSSENKCRMSVERNLIRPHWSPGCSFYYINPFEVGPDSLE